MTNLIFALYNFFVNMRKFISFLKKRYFISSMDLADSAETNRLHLLFLSNLLLLVGVGDLIVLSAIQISRGGVKPVLFIYFGLFTLASLFILIYSLLSKRVSREKAYIVKTLPFYIALAISMLAAVCNFYILDQPFNGVLVFGLTGLIALIVFSFYLIPYIIIIIIGYVFLLPGVYKNFGLTGLLDTMLLGNLICGLAFYKRRVEKDLLELRIKQKKNLEVKTFGNFTILNNHKVIKFSRTKSLELLAYLIYKKGSSVQTKELLAVLYGEHADSARYGASLRNLIVDIKRSLSELEIQKFFIAEYNNFRINPEVIKCDYYDFLAGDAHAIKSFSGEFMSQFSWAEDTAAFLEQKVLK